MNDWHTDLAWASLLLAEVVTRRTAKPFCALFVIRLCVELLARYSENSYLDLRAGPAALSAFVLVLVGIWMARRIVRDGDNVALLATAVAVALATFVGVQDLADRQQSQSSPPATDLRRRQQ